ncbi:expressed unknown protein [Seminavis robusta]|uniref:Uncharacterized protein n=1 Tax=Seminavis robusta TaxID=568900 RepID=A0A9N8F305_9STRA|nr:expressed unknown protein [Seminavis robusta]|eukprot:Sro2963_g341050.1 n/a (144) ;mRNA; f:2695-3126
MMMTNDNDNNPSTGTTKKTKLWSRRKRRHIRNETLTIVWNYTSNLLQHWWANARGYPPPPEPNPPRRAILEHPKDWLVPSPSDESTNDPALNTTTTTTERRDTNATPQTQETVTRASSTIVVEMATMPTTATDNSNDVVLQID